MKVPCKYCCQSGNVVEYIGYPVNSTGYYPQQLNNYTISICKSCNGTGWVDDEEMIRVPRKYIKDEFLKTGF